MWLGDVGRGWFVNQWFCLSVRGCVRGIVLVATCNELFRVNKCIETWLGTQRGPYVERARQKQAGMCAARLASRHSLVSEEAAITLARYVRPEDRSGWKE
jgi:hypothetical protein